LVDVFSKDAIAVVDEEAVGMTARQSFSELLQRPFRCGMGRDVVVEKKEPGMNA
jgi:hypothetical protein